MRVRAAETEAGGKRVKRTGSMGFALGVEMLRFFLNRRAAMPWQGALLGMSSRWGMVRLAGARRWTHWESLKA